MINQWAAINNNWICGGELILVKFRYEAIFKHEISTEKRIFPKFAI